MDHPSRLEVGAAAFDHGEPWLDHPASPSARLAGPRREIPAQRRDASRPTRSNVVGVPRLGVITVETNLGASRRGLWERALSTRALWERTSDLR